MTEPIGSEPTTTPSGLIRSEEELVVTTELVVTGHARLVKRVEVETVTRTIELRREVLEIERLDTPEEAGSPGGPASTSSPGAVSEVPSGPLVAGSFTEAVVEIVLMQEEALITTEMVPRERIRLSKRVLTEERVVEADLQVERFDLEERSAAVPGDSAGADQTDLPR